MKKLLLLLNLHSGKGEIKNHIAGLIDIYNKADYEVTVYSSQYAGHIAKIIKSTGENYDMVVCSGGDGTLSETSAAVAKLNKKPVIGYIPSGSANDFAASVGIPKKPLEAAEITINGKDFTVDLGCMDNKNFIYVAAFGAFTNVSYETSQSLKNILGYQAYVLEGIKQLASIKSYHMRVEWDGNNFLEDDIIVGIVSNTRSIAGMKYITAEDTQLDDGLFEVLLIPNIQNPRAVKGLIKDIAEKDYTNPQTIYSFKAKKIRFICSEPVSWTIDGENGGTACDTKLSVINRIVTIRVPQVTD